MSAETELQLARRGSDNALVFADARVRLIARGRVDAALVFLEPPNPPDPFLEIRQFAEAGDDNAQLELFLELPDLFLKIRQRAEAGDDDAQLKLGDAYYYGRGVHQDYKEAARWYCRAADQNQNFNRLSADQQFNLRLLFYLGSGEGFPKDDRERARWCRLVAEQGKKEAQDLLEQLVARKLKEFRKPRAG